jgi:hypothetical protein
MHFLQGVLDGVGDFLQIDLADDVETVFRHVRALSENVKYNL